MVGIATAIGVVAASLDLALMVEQPIEHMRGFAGGRRDHLGVERRVSVGEVRVELDPGFGRSRRPERTGHPRRRRSHRQTPPQAARAAAD